MMNGNEAVPHIVPKLLTIIVDRDNSDKLLNVLHGKQLLFQYKCNAMGTANSEILKTFGLSGTEKIICACIVPAYKSSQMLAIVAESMEIVKPGKGIAFVVPISSVGAFISNSCDKLFADYKEGWQDYMESTIEKNSHETHFELVLTVVNQGYSDIVMEAARASGARGGTIINARRTGIDEAIKFFGISLQSEKEIVSIVISKEQKKELMQSISKHCGMATDAKGIMISLPVEDCVGIAFEEVH